jgi:hypothetical protein
MWATSAIFKQLSTVTHHQLGENSPNLATLRKPKVNTNSNLHQGTLGKNFGEKFRRFSARFGEKKENFNVMQFYVGYF